jgi:outer membrane protein OmpA-like peptidoglycan-associated protein
VLRTVHDNGRSGPGYIVISPDPPPLLPRLAAFYARHKPDKDADEVRAVAEYFNGQESELEAKLLQEYGVGLASLASLASLAAAVADDSAAGSRQPRQPQAQQRAQQRAQQQAQRQPPLAASASAPALAPAPAMRTSASAPTVGLGGTHSTWQAAIKATIGHGGSLGQGKRDGRTPPVSALAAGGVEAEEGSMDLDEHDAAGAPTTASVCPRGPAATHPKPAQNSSVGAAVPLFDLGSAVPRFRGYGTRDAAEWGCWRQHGQAKQGVGQGADDLPNAQVGLGPAAVPAPPAQCHIGKGWRVIDKRTNRLGCTTTFAYNPKTGEIEGYVEGRDECAAAAKAAMGAAWRVRPIIERWRAGQAAAGVRQAMAELLRVRLPVIDKEISEARLRMIQRRVLEVMLELYNCTPCSLIEVDLPAGRINMVKEVEFQGGKAVFKSSAAVLLEQLVVVRQAITRTCAECAFQDMHWYVEGHTAPSSKADGGMALSMARSVAVCRHITAANGGSGGALLLPKGFGMYAPPAEGKDPRRVEIRVVDPAVITAVATAFCDT